MSAHIFAKVLLLLFFFSLKTHFEYPPLEKWHRRHLWTRHDFFSLHCKKKKNLLKSFLLRVIVCPGNKKWPRLPPASMKVTAACSLKRKMGEFRTFRSCTEEENFCSMWSNRQEVAESRGLVTLFLSARHSQVSLWVFFFFLSFFFCV